MSQYRISIKRYYKNSRGKWKHFETETMKVHKESLLPYTCYYEDFGVKCKDVIVYKKKLKDKNE